MKTVWKIIKKIKGGLESSKTLILNINGNIKFEPSRVPEALVCNIPTLNSE